MKCLFTVFFVLFASVFLRAQISISSANMPVSGDTIRYSDALLSSVGDYTTTGTNHTWLFDTLKPIQQSVREFKSGINTPYSIIFGFTAYGEKTQDTVPVPSIPISGVPSISITDVYNFYSKTSTKFITEGLGLKLNGVPVPNFFSNEDELYFFPLNYSDRDSSTFRFSTLSNTLIPFQYVKQGYRITEADGWGTITTPHGTENCLRIITTQYSIDTIKGTITLPFVGATPFSFGFPNYVRSYQWLTITEKIPYFEVSGNLTTLGVFTPTQAKYRDFKQSLTGIEEHNQLNTISVYPNPSNGDITLFFNNEFFGTIEITDIQGNLVKSETVNASFANKIGEKINLEGLAKGTYMLNAITNKGKQSVKISIQ